MTGTDYAGFSADPGDIGVFHRGKTTRSFPQFQQGAPQICGFAGVFSLLFAKKRWKTMVEGGES